MLIIRLWNFLKIIKKKRNINRINCDWIEIKNKIKNSKWRKKLKNDCNHPIKSSVYTVLSQLHSFKMKTITKNCNDSFYFCLGEILKKWELSITSIRQFKWLIMHISCLCVHAKNYYNWSLVNTNRQLILNVLLFCKKYSYSSNLQFFTNRFCRLYFVTMSIFYFENTSEINKIYL